MFTLSILALRDNDHVLAEVQLHHPDPVQVDAALKSTSEFVTSGDGLTTQVRRASPQVLVMDAIDDTPWDTFHGDIKSDTDGRLAILAAIPHCTIDECVIREDEISIRLLWDFDTFEALDQAMKTDLLRE